MHRPGSLVPDLGSIGDEGVGEVWFADVCGDKRRPVLVLS